MESLNQDSSYTRLYKNEFAFKRIQDCYILLQVTAMRENANLAEIFSTEGLDSYHKGLIDEVKNIALKCNNLKKC
jgi:hypothetical protein